MAKKPTFPKRIFTGKTPSGEAFQIGDGGAHFDLTAAKLKEAVEDQAKWAEQAQSPFTGVSPEQAGVNKARREIGDWHVALEQTEIALAVAKGRAAKAELKVRRDHFKTLVAEAFATLGLFAEALAMVPKGDKLRRAEWKALQDALNRTEDCPCTVENHPFLVTLDRLHKMVFNAATGQMVPVVACNICNQLSVKGISNDLAKHREVRAKAAQIAQGRAPDVAHAALRQAGLTSEKVFGIR